MKTKTNIALEGTRNGNVVGGLYREPREHLQALLFGKEERNRIILRGHKNHETPGSSQIPRASRLVGFEKEEVRYGFKTIS